MGFFKANYENPADSGMNYLNQIPETVTPYYKPYISLGQGAARASAPVYYQMATNPQGYYNDIMSDYTESPQYQYNYDKNMKIMQGDAAAGGYTGTEYDQNRQAEMNRALMSQDQQQYYNDVTRAQQYGLQGGQHYYDTGYRASDTLANMLAQNLAIQGGLAYQGTAWDNSMKAQHRNNMFTAAGMGAGYMLYPTQQSPAPITNL